MEEMVLQLTGHEMRELAVHLPYTNHLIYLLTYCAVYRGKDLQLFL